MASNTYHTIAIRGLEKRDEAIAAGSAGIKPGMLLGFNSTGQVKKHAVAAGNARPTFVALESPTAKPGADAAIDTAYVDGDTVYYATPQAGDVGYLFLAHSTGNTAVKGVSTLVSAGNGYVKVAALTTGVVQGAIVGVPDESVDNSSGTGPVRLRVKFA